MLNIITLRIAGSVLATVLFCAAFVAAQDEPASAGQRPTFHAATDLTLVRFHVIRSNRYVGGLSRGDVRLLDNGAERDFELFEGGCGGAPRTLPVEIALLFDTSGSVMVPGLLDWITYRDTLLRTTVGARVSVYGYSRDLRRYSGPTSDPEQLRDALTKVLQTTAESAPGAVTIPLDPPGKKSRDAEWNRLYESVLTTAQELSASPATQILLVVSDGERSSNTDLNDVIGKIQALGVSVFPVIVGHRSLVEASQQAGGAVPGNSFRSYLEGRQRDVSTFARLGELTGGRSFDPPTVNPEIVKSMLGIVAETIRCEYVVGFAARRTEGTPRRHDLEVKLRTKDAGWVAGGKRRVLY